VVSTCDFLERIQLNKVVQSSVSEEIPPLTQQAIHSRPTLSSVYTPPRNEIEQTLVELWQNVLGIGQIGILDDFFELGGHSLLATQLISRIREKLMVELPLAHLFESPTIASLAEYITIKHLAKQTFQVSETLASEDEEGVL
jgi:acyl carrier protein